jgi:hypothetical protein
MGFHTIIGLANLILLNLLGESKMANVTLKKDQSVKANYDGDMWDAVVIKDMGTKVKIKYTDDDTVATVAKSKIEVPKPKGRPAKATAKAAAKPAASKAASGKAASGNLTLAGVKKLLEEMEARLMEAIESNSSAEELDGGEEEEEDFGGDEEEETEEEEGDFEEEEEGDFEEEEEDDGDDDGW